MNNNFEALKNEVKELVKTISTNETAIINYINTLLEKFNSKLSVRKNMSIGSFERLLVNSSNVEEFKTFLNRLDVNKEYEIKDLAELNDDIEFNEECKNDDLEQYELYKNFLDSRVKLNDNLFIIEYK